MNEAHKSEWIQRYLEGELSGQELLDFEQHLEKDPGLQTLLEEHKILVGGIRYQARIQAWDRIKTLEATAEEAEDTSQQVSMGKNVRFMYWSVAAAVAVLVVSVVYFINVNQPINSDQLFAENFAPYPTLAYAPQRSDTSFASVMEQAFAMYSNGNYEAAIPLFEDALTQREETLIWFYLGNAYLADGQSEQAIASFQKFLEQGSELSTQARWYLALAYLEQEQLKDAELLFIELSEGDNTYSKRAAQILEIFN